MAYPEAFVGGLVLFVVGLHAIRIPDRAYRAGMTDVRRRPTEAGMGHVKLEAAVLGAVGLFVMLLAAFA